MVFHYCFSQSIVVRRSDSINNENIKNSNNNITWFFFIVSYSLVLAVEVIEIKMNIKRIVIIKLYYFSEKARYLDATRFQ